MPWFTPQVSRHQTEEIIMANSDITKVFRDRFQQAVEEISKDIIGNVDVVENIIIAMIAGGNVLLEGVPGTGKTRLIRSMGKAMNLSFSRIQFLPDLMPTDVTGTQLLEKKENGQVSFRFQPGPVFSNIVLADEINRATPKTQSALLEAMQEHMVSVAGTDYPLPEPFFVLATQNPIEQEGTYSLPEAQLDRFMFKLNMAFPTNDQLKEILTLTQKTQEILAQPVWSGEILQEMRAIASQVPVADEVTAYLIGLVSATHPELPGAVKTTKDYILIGASPRAAQALMTASKIKALSRGAYNVSFKDVQALAHPVLRHRIRLNFDAAADGKDADALITALLGEMEEKPGLLRRKA